MCLPICMCVSVCVCACVRASVYVRACVRASMCVWFLLGKGGGGVVAVVEGRGASLEGLFVFVSSFACYSVGFI